MVFAEPEVLEFAGYHFIISQIGLQLVSLFGSSIGLGMHSPCPLPTHLLCFAKGDFFWGDNNEATFGAQRPSGRFEIILLLIKLILLLAQLAACSGHGLKPRRGYFM